MISLCKQQFDGEYKSKSNIPQPRCSAVNTKVKATYPNQGAVLYIVFLYARSQSNVDGVCIKNAYTLGYFKNLIN